MIPFLKDVTRLQNYNLPGSKRLAMKLLLTLGFFSVFEPVEGCPDPLDVDSTFQSLADPAMVQLARARREEEGHGWNVRRVLRELETTAEEVDYFHIGPYFKSSRKLLKEWAEDQASDSEEGSDSDGY
jgi:hypothetical protein